MEILVRKKGKNPLAGGWVGWGFFGDGGLSGLVVCF